MTEQAPRGEVARGQAEVQEWVYLVGEEWVVQEQVQVRLENVCVQNVEQPLLMRSEHPVTL